MISFVSGFFWETCDIHLYRVAVVHPFLSLWSIALYEYTTISFIQSTVDEQCIEFETITNTAATNVINIALRTHVHALLSGMCPWKEITGSYTRKYQTLS